MAAGSLLALLDDIAVLLDDIALMSKTAVKKTAGVLGDDLAVNAEQVSGVRAARELPVVWAVAKGSLVNKAIVVPLVLLVSGLLPVLITPLLMVGGAYLCLEGAEKVWHSLHRHASHAHREVKALLQAQSLLSLEREKIRGAIRTDFILSLEIVVIALGSIQTASFIQQCVVLSLVAIGITVAVYGLVAVIVKLDDAGLYLQQFGAVLKALGRGLLWLAPVLMKSLSVLGTLAMFLVGGSILSHGLEHYLGHGLLLSPMLLSPSELVEDLVRLSVNGVVGLVMGAVLLGIAAPLRAMAARGTS